jgi:hypothetical protein
MSRRVDKRSDQRANPIRKSFLEQGVEADTRLDEWPPGLAGPVEEG